MRAGCNTVNLNTRDEVTKQLELFAVARNVFDDKYETFGVMNRNCFHDGQPERFLGPRRADCRLGWDPVRFD